ncbi:hypothetical protein BH09PAT3_BH09PAT3_5910 [soil metagenome]
MFQIDSRGWSGNLEDRILADNWRPTNNYDPVHEDNPAMAEDPDLYDKGLYNHSLVRQLSSTLVGLSLDTESGNTGFFFSANSALPLAHTIRGFFDECDLPQPHIDHISTYPEIWPWLTDTFKWGDQIKSEAERLKQIVAAQKLGSAVIIDECIASGETIHTSIGVLKDAGIAPRAIYPIVGAWYEQLDFEEGDDPKRFMNIDPASYPLAGYFYMLGSLAGKRLGELNPTAIEQYTNSCS